MFKRFLSFFILISFFCQTVIPAQAGIQALPAPGTMVNLSPAFEPVLVKGLKVNQENPFLFDFIVDSGDTLRHSEQSEESQQEFLKKEVDRLIKYFFAGLTIPEKDLWVNLSPYEKDRTVPESLAKTALGRDLLAQDYILKQLTATLIYPEKELGKAFWDKVYAKAQQLYGTSEIPVNTFNKVWIIADKATVFERNQVAYVLEGHLKVMLEEDYLAKEKANTTKQQSVASQVIRDIILPELEKEINQGQNFAPLRQMYYSLILAGWFKNNLKQALLNQVYSDKSVVKGLEYKSSVIASPKGAKQSQQEQPRTDVELIYQQYLEAYKKGVFNYIKDPDPTSVGSGATSLPRKYFSGGLTPYVNPEVVHNVSPAAPAMITGSAAMVSVNAGLNNNPSSAQTAEVEINQIYTNETEEDLIQLLRKAITSTDLPLNIGTVTFNRSKKNMIVFASQLLFGDHRTGLDRTQFKPNITYDNERDWFGFNFQFFGERIGSLTISPPISPTPRVVFSDAHLAFLGLKREEIPENNDDPKWQDYQRDGIIYVARILLRAFEGIYTPEQIARISVDNEFDFFPKGLEEGQRQKGVLRLIAEQEMSHKDGPTLSSPAMIEVGERLSQPFMDKIKASLGKRPVILFVDDEDVQLGKYRELEKDYKGLRFVFVKSKQEALGVIEKDLPGLIVTDRDFFPDEEHDMLINKLGLQFVNELAAKYTDLPVILTSGGTVSEQLPPSAEYLQKRFLLGELWWVLKPWHNKGAGAVSAAMTGQASELGKMQHVLGVLDVLGHIRIQGERLFLGGVDMKYEGVGAKLGTEILRNIANKFSLTEVESLNWIGVTEQIRGEIIEELAKYWTSVRSYLQEATVEDFNIIKGSGEKIGLIVEMPKGFYPLIIEGVTVLAFDLTGQAPYIKYTVSGEEITIDLNDVRNIRGNQGARIYLVRAKPAVNLQDDAPDVFAGVDFADLNNNPVTILGNLMPPIKTAKQDSMLFLPGSSAPPLLNAAMTSQPLAVGQSIPIAYKQNRIIVSYGDERNPITIFSKANGVVLSQFDGTYTSGLAPERLELDTVVSEDGAKQAETIHFKLEGDNLVITNNTKRPITIKQEAIKEEVIPVQATDILIDGKKLTELIGRREAFSVQRRYIDGFLIDSAYLKYFREKSNEVLEEEFQVALRESTLFLGAGSIQDFIRKVNGKGLNQYFAETVNQVIRLDVAQEKKYLALLREILIRTGFKGDNVASGYEELGEFDPTGWKVKSYHGVLGRVVGRVSNTEVEVRTFDYREMKFASKDLIFIREQGLSADNLLSSKERGKLSQPVSTEVDIPLLKQDGFILKVNHYGGSEGIIQTVSLEDVRPDGRILIELDLTDVIGTNRLDIINKRLRSSPSLIEGVLNSKERFSRIQESTIRQDSSVDWFIRQMNGLIADIAYQFTSAAMTISNMKTDTPIAEVIVFLSLSYKAEQALNKVDSQDGKHRGVKVAGDINYFSAEDFTRKRVGKKVIEEIRHKFAQLGFYLKGETPSAVMTITLEDSSNKVIPDNGPLVNQLKSVYGIDKVRDFTRYAAGDLIDFYGLKRVVLERIRFVLFRNGAFLKDEEAEIRRRSASIDLKAGEVEETVNLNQDFTIVVRKKLDLDRPSEMGLTSVIIVDQHFEYPRLEISRPLSEHPQSTIALIRGRLSAKEIKGVLSMSRIIAAVLRLDAAMTDIELRKASTGGIDLMKAAQNTAVQKEGAGVQMKVDSAMINRIRQQGALDRLDPIIYKVTPITSIWPILGLEPPKREEELAAI